MFGCTLQDCSESSRRKRRRFCLRTCAKHIQGGDDRLRRLPTSTIRVENLLQDVEIVKKKRKRKKEKKKSESKRIRTSQPTPTLVPIVLRDRHTCYESVLFTKSGDITQLLHGQNSGGVGFIHPPPSITALGFASGQLSRVS